MRRNINLNRQNLHRQKLKRQKEGNLRILALLLLLAVLGGFGVYYFIGPSESLLPTPQPVAKPEAQAPPLPATAPAREVARAAAPISSPEPEKNVLYTLQTETFLFKSRAVAAEKVIRKLGYKPEMREEIREVKMTRLLIGTFPKQKAKAMRKNLLAKAPNIFLLSKGDQVSVYAGSYGMPAFAEQEKNRLAAEGIMAEKVAAMMPMPVQILTFGVFTDRSAAQTAADLVRATGLKVLILAQP
jgi:hypothetical protein